MSRFEELMQKLLNGETIAEEDFPVMSRLEKALIACINKTGTDGLDIPQSRAEELLQLLSVQMTLGGGGSYIPKTEQVTITPTEEVQEVTPTEGSYFDKVTVEAVQTEEVTVTPTEEVQEVIPTEGSYFDKVTVEAVEATSGIVDVDELPVAWKGTVVPNSGNLKKIYWNINLSTEEVNRIIRNYVKTSGKTYGYVYCWGSLSSYHGYIYIYYNNGSGKIQRYDSGTLYTLFENGWTTSNGYVSYGYPGKTLEDKFSGDDIGTYNYLLTSLFSTTEFIQEYVDPEPIYRLPNGTMWLYKDSSWEQYAKSSSVTVSSTEKNTYIWSPEDTFYSGISIQYGTESSATSTYQLFYYSSTEKIRLIDTSNVINMESMFKSCEKITDIPLLDTRKVENMKNMFSGCKNLLSIPPIDTSNVADMSNMFSNCTSLKSILMYGMKVSFDISASTQFEQSDLVTILNNLATVESATLTMGETNLAKLTDEDKLIATNKGWTLA